MYTVNSSKMMDVLFCSETLNWEANIDPNFRSQWWKECEVMSEGEWGRVVRLFYHIFYGEGVVIKPGHTYQREKDDRPFAGKLKQSIYNECPQLLSKTFVYYIQA